MRIALLAVALLTPLASNAQPVRALPGHACALLATPGSSPPVLEQPSATARRVGIASDQVIVSTQRTPMNGYAPVKHLDGRDGWIDARQLRPWRSASDPSATCTPVIANGRLAFG